MPLTLEFGVNTFLWHFEFSALDNCDRLGRLVARTFGYVLDLVNNLVALEHLAEDNVAAIEPADQLCQQRNLTQ